MDIPPIMVRARVDDALVSQTFKIQYIAELWMLTTPPYASFQKRYPSMILKPISMFASSPKFMMVLKNFLKLQKSLRLLDSPPISNSFTFTQTGLAQCSLQLFKNYVPLTRKRLYSRVPTNKSASSIKSIISNTACYDCQEPVTKSITSSRANLFTDRSSPTTQFHLYPCNT